jgi:hypothetical protein
MHTQLRILSALLFFAGLILCAVALYQVYKPLCPAFCGTVAFYLGRLAWVEARKEKR